MAGYAEWRQRTGMAKQTIFQRSRNGPFRRIGSQLPPGMERNHRPAVFQSLCRGMGTLQRMLGQFKTPDIAAWTKAYDPSRLVNPASGGNHYTCGDILDLHNYPGPDLYLYDPMRATVLGEYGGIGLVMKDHLWMPDRNWGYVKFNNPEEVTTEYIKYAEHLLQLIPRGFSAGVYTQITDVEGEVNGLMTYDRKEIKVNEKKIREMNQKICNSLK